MKPKNISPYKGIRALIANKLTLSLVVLKNLTEGKKVNKRIIIKALKDLQKLEKLIAYADKRWIPRLEKLNSNKPEFKKSEEKDASAG